VSTEESRIKDLLESVKRQKL